MINGTVPTTKGFSGFSNLESLELSFSTVNSSFLQNIRWMTSLKKLYMSSCKLSSTLPTSQVNDTLSGPIQLPIHPHMNLSYLDISNNGFHGYIPQEIAALPKLTSLNMSGNGFSDSIPSLFGNMSGLQVLDLSNNRLSGGIPEHMTMGCFSLNFLLLSNNKLQGPIFLGYFNLTNLWWLSLDGNQFNGSIPDSLSSCSSLTRFYANKNHLWGKIPGWMGNMSSLEVLDLSQNIISESLPYEFGPLQMEQVYLSRNKLQGSLKDAFRDCSKLMTLDLSHNYFTGNVPGWIDRFPQLSYLLLSHNKLEGEILVQLCKLNQLSLVDLSYNNLSGHILPCLKFNSEWNRQQETISAPSPDPIQQPIEFTTKSNSYSYQESILTYLSGLDLSCNNLTGEIPAEIGYLNKIQVLNLSHNSLTEQMHQHFQT
ncbi:serine-threonine protein kinase, plant-type, putative [Ricinus communis]|uniref:Serine-threonine protein kinase, plant-type, putative n=1 Tax=Ricinus communis TaxID=3988 RepID=B9SZM5_RICCO|nr:serine-threonine protein kinase, plant-type, putative [Ricinus communis]